MNEVEMYRGRGPAASDSQPGPNSVEYLDDPSLDEVDSSTGLTERQKRVMRETWNEMQKNLAQNGVDLFIMIFQAHPSYQSKFKGLENLSVEQLKKSKRLQAHGTSVMYSFASMVDNLNDVECLKEVLLKVGKNHIRRKITETQFENVGAVAVDFFQLTIGPNFTPFARTAWESALKVINAIIAQGLAGEDD